MAFSAYFVFTEAVKGGGHVIVPDVVGLPVTEAAFLLAEEGLEVGKQEQVVSNRLPEYHVILQRPAANKVVRSGRKVNLTISAGRQLEEAPNLVGTDFKAALQALEGTRLLAGTIARIPNEAQRDVVLAQDPAASRELPTGGEIHLLLSDGPAAAALYMPDLIGTPVTEALDLLVSLNIKVIPYAIGRAGADYDVVLEQNPEAGTFLHENQVVSIDVRPLPSTVLPNVRRKVEVVYTVPATSYNPEVRVDVVDQGGGRKVVFPRKSDYIDGEAPRLQPGTKITIPVSFSAEATVEFYADGEIDLSYRFKGNEEPVVTDYRKPLETEDSAEVGGGEPVGAIAWPPPVTPGERPQWPPRQMEPGEQSHAESQDRAVPTR